MFPPTIVRKPQMAEDIALGVQLARMYDRLISPSGVARVMQLASVEFVIVGAHAINGYTGRPRATVDVDVVAERPEKASRAIASAYPRLVRQAMRGVIRFRDEDHEAIDVIRPTTSALWRRLIHDAIEVRVSGTTLRI